MNTTEIIFAEKQRFRSPWLWGLLLPITSIFLYGVVRKVFYDIDFIINMPGITLYLSSAVLLALVIVFYYLEMETQVKEDGIYLRLGLLKGEFKYVPFSEVTSYKVVKYNVWEKGGRGVCHTENTLAFTVSGNTAMEFTLLHGKTLLVGTTDAEDFFRSLNKMRIFN